MTKSEPDLNPAWTLESQIFLVIVFVVTGLSSQRQDVDWCNTGQKQSPINLNVTGNPVKKAEPFSFLHYDDTPSMTYVNNSNGRFEIRGGDAKMLPQVPSMCYTSLFLSTFCICYVFADFWRWPGRPIQLCPTALSLGL